MADFAGVRASFGMQTHVALDESENKMVWRRSQDCTPIVERNKRLQIDGQKVIEELGERIASIPLVIVMKWKRDYGVDALNPDHEPAVRRLLNGDYSYLRTTAKPLGKDVSQRTPGFIMPRFPSKPRDTVKLSEGA